MASSSSSLYSTVRASVDETGSDSRVEVNQRALIDKILARYASAGAVYRELLQNSNDAEASMAEVHFTIDEHNVVKQVLYRNNGIPFRGQDWARLKKIAEGNPDVSKVGAFGVGAYTMFSICEEPLVISGDQALAFFWKGDALWTKTATASALLANLTEADKRWTSFVLPSRDPYPLPDLVEFAEFLVASLTFTKCLTYLRVFVNEEERVFVQKTQIQEPTTITPPQSSSWWKNDGANTSSKNGCFYLSNSRSLKESVYQLDVLIDGDVSSTRARYVSAVAKTRINSAMAHRMERVTKKQPPSEVNVEIFLNAGQDEPTPNSRGRNKADIVTQSFAPKRGKGRIFIGFRTSQTTGFACHLAAPFFPTVEREAIDLQDQTLRLYNSELLEFSGILMRLTLEHSMSLVDTDWKLNAPARENLEKELAMKKKTKSADPAPELPPADATKLAEEETEDKSSGLFGFMAYMAKGVKKQIVSVVNTVEKVLDDGAEYMNPPDPRPLSSEESHAILLMQSFCCEQSTPDPLIGTCLAEGFSHCMPNTVPPVLTRAGVMRGDEARLPFKGMEMLVEDFCIRQVVYTNTEEYHDVIARVKCLTLNDVADRAFLKPMEAEKLIWFLKWWTKFARFDPYGTRAHAADIKEKIRFYWDSSNTPPESAKQSADQRAIMSLSNLLFYAPKDGPLSRKKLPMPETVIPSALQEQIGYSSLEDSSLERWFQPVPIEIWAEFISHHHSMVAGLPEDDELRFQVLGILSKEYDQRPLGQRAAFGGYCQRLLGEKRCLNFESSEPSQFAAECPSALYLHSAELKAFEGIGSFRKVSQAFKTNGVSDEFLVALGVRNSVAIEFLFSNLDTLKWSNDPKPLIEYLRTASLTNKDVAKLKSSQYLPAENDQSRTFAPQELFLPDQELSACFPFLRVLQWPAEDGLTSANPNGKFLIKLGMHELPSLDTVLQYLSTRVNDDQKRIQCLDYLCRKMAPHSAWQTEFSRMNRSRKSEFKFIPCVRATFLDPKSEKKELCSPVSCFTEIGCGIMSYPVIDPELGDSGRLYGSNFQCPQAPDPDTILNQLLLLVKTAKQMQKSVAGKNQSELSGRILTQFGLIFKYLSCRTSEFSSGTLASLRNVNFIPCASQEDGVRWFKPDQVFFKKTDLGSGSDDGITSLLYEAVEFSSFLSQVGVKEEASARDLFLLLIASPEKVLETLGSEKKYRTLLRRIAAAPPFRSVTAQMRSSAWLLAYTGKSDNDDKNDLPVLKRSNYKLARAEDIFIIDNYYFGRMFNVLRSPHESDLEEFYSMLGSSYISKTVEKRFEVVGRAVGETSLVSALRERIQERAPLLMSPAVTSRPLVSSAASILDKEKLTLFEADALLAVYSLRGEERRQSTTCCVRPLTRQKNALYVTSKFDFFDVGFALGDLLLQRCQLEDAFFFSSLLEAPLEQLRARGFPVDRIIKPEPPPEPVKPPPPPPPPLAQPAPAALPSEPTPTIVSIPEGESRESDGKQQPCAGPNTNDQLPSQIDVPTDDQNPSSSPPANDTTNSVPHRAPTSSGSTGHKHTMTNEEIVAAIKQMFPEADDAYLKSRLGPSPTVEDVQMLAEEMMAGNYLKQLGLEQHQQETHFKDEQHHDHNQSSKKGKSGFRKSLKNAFRGGLLGHSHALSGSSKEPVKGAATAAAAAAATEMGASLPPQQTGPVSPEHDAASHSNMEAMLRHMTGQSAPVNAKGVKSADTVLTHIPKELDRGSTCEVVPGQSLKPFLGPRGDGRTHYGIQLFSARNFPESEEFLQTNYSAVESFALVLKRLGEVFEVNMNSLAIFHDPTGGTIAFNANKSLHFNVRFFYALHYFPGQHESYNCYSYWFVTFAHELAHHLVSAHNKEHGFYTENYVSLYLPRLLRLMSSLPTTN